MTTSLWIGFGFTTALVVFLMISFFVKDKVTHSQYATLRFLTSLCAGFAGGFFTGDALFRWDQQLADGAKIAISGTTGCALFFTIWFTYPKFPGDSIDPNLVSTALSIPSGWSFEKAVRAIVLGANAQVNFEGFNSANLAALLKPTDINTKTPKDAIMQLRYQSAELPPYKVEFESGVYHVSVNP